MSRFSFGDDEVPWRSNRQIFSQVTNQFEMEPIGELCAIHGFCLDSLPKIKTTEELKEYIKNRKNKLEFNFVEKGVETVFEQIKDKFAAQSVSSSKSTGITIRRKLAFITGANFQRHFKVTMADVPSCKTVNLPFIQDGRADTKGVIMEIWNVPSKLPFEELEVWHTLDRCINTVVLSPDHIFRALQPTERYNATVEDFNAMKPKSATALPGAGLQYDQVRKESKKVRQDRKLENRNMGDGVGDEDEEVGVVTTGMVPNLASDDFGATAKGTQKKGGAGKRRGAKDQQPRSGRRSGAPSAKALDSTAGLLNSIAGSVFDAPFGPTPSAVPRTPARLGAPGTPAARSSSVGLAAPGTPGLWASGSLRPSSSSAVESPRADGVMEVNLCDGTQAPQEFLYRVMANYSPGRELGKVCL